MLLLVVVSAAVIICPTLSQPTRSDAFDDGDYPVPIFRDRGDWGEAPERSFKGVGATSKNKAELTDHQLSTSKNNPKYNEMFLMNKDQHKSDLTKERVMKRETGQNELVRRQYELDPIGGGYLLRRQSAFEQNLKENHSDGTNLKEYLDMINERLMTKDTNPEETVKRQYEIDPIGGGYLLRRQLSFHPDNKENLVKKLYTLDPIGGGYLLKRGLESDFGFGHVHNNRPNTLAKESIATSLSSNVLFRPGKPRRSPSRKSEILLKILPKDEVITTLATDPSFLNNKDFQIVEMGLQSFPIDPIGGGYLLGRSANYDSLKSKSSYPYHEDEPSRNRQLLPGNYFVH